VADAAWRDWYEWDEHKSEENLRLRGFDFAFATLLFEGPGLIYEDTRKDYGERRWVRIGMADGVFLTVVYTDRESGVRVRDRTYIRPVRRIISARRSKRTERERYKRSMEMLEKGLPRGRSGE
jgi:uncharacterized DUF497 family protein